MNVVVIPSNRPHQLDAWWKAWKEVADWDALVVVEDAASVSSVKIPGAVRLCWSDIDKHALGSLISRQDAAIRSFGYLEASTLGARYIGTMDDDCLPHDLSWFGSHLHAMRISRWTSPAGIPARGVPFRNCGQGASALNMGLWHNVADWSAVHQLANSPTDFTPPDSSDIIPVGQYFPMSGMNLVFHRDLLPLMLHPPMGRGEVYRRFDDIWCGILMKKVCDVCNVLVTAGTPGVWHARASDAIQNLGADAPGIARTETFWQSVDEVPLNAPPTDWARGRRISEATSELGCGLQHSDDEYLKRVGQRLTTWSEYFSC